MSAAPSHGSGGGGGKSHAKTAAIWGAIVVALIAVGQYNRNKEDGPPPERTSDSAVRPSAARSDAEPAASDPHTEDQSTCPPFTADGASCEISSRTNWIRAKSDAPAGSERFCWDNPNDQFAMIEYKAGGREHIFDPAGPPPSGVMAYRFTPKDPMTLDYNLAAMCR